MEKAFDLLDKIKTDNETARKLITKIRKYIFKKQLNDKLLDKLDDLKYMFDKNKKNKNYVKKIIRHLTSLHKNKHPINYNLYGTPNVINYDPYQPYVPGVQTMPGQGQPIIQGISGMSVNLKHGDWVYVTGNINTNDFCTAFEGPTNIRNVNVMNKLGVIVDVYPANPAFGTTTPLYCIKFQDESQGKYGIEISPDKIMI
jgi:hypothetical protein